MKGQVEAADRSTVSKGIATQKGRKGFDKLWIPMTLGITDLEVAECLLILPLTIRSQHVEADRPIMVVGHHVDVGAILVGDVLQRPERGDRIGPAVGVQLHMEPRLTGDLEVMHLERHGNPEIAGLMADQNRAFLNTGARIEGNCQVDQHQGNLAVGITGVPIGRKPGQLCDRCGP